MELRCTSPGLEVFEIGAGWSGDEIFRTWMEMRRHLDGCEMQISGHVLRLNMTWM